MADIVVTVDPEVIVVVEDDIRVTVDTEAIIIELEN